MRPLLSQQRQSELEEAQKGKDKAARERRPSIDSDEARTSETSQTPLSSSMQTCSGSLEEIRVKRVSGVKPSEEALVRPQPRRRVDLPTAGRRVAAGIASYRAVRDAARSTDPPKRCSLARTTRPSRPPSPDQLVVSTAF